MSSQTHALAREATATRLGREGLGWPVSAVPVGAVFWRPAVKGEAWNARALRPPSIASVDACACAMVSEMDMVPASCGRCTRLRSARHQHTLSPRRKCVVCAQQAILLPPRDRLRVDPGQKGRVQWTAGALAGTWGAFDARRGCGRGGCLLHREYGSGTVMRLLHCARLHGPALRRQPVRHRLSAPGRARRSSQEGVTGRGVTFTLGVQQHVALQLCLCVHAAHGGRQGRSHV